MIRDKATQKAYELQDRASAEARAKFLTQIMQDEGVDWDMALAIATGHTEPREPEYTLGYKMSDPILMIAMFTQPGKKARAQAIANFEATLEPDELELFQKEVLPMKTGEMLKSALKRKNRR